MADTLVNLCLNSVINTRGKEEDLLLRCPEDLRQVIVTTIKARLSKLEQPAEVVSKPKSDDGVNLQSSAELEKIIDSYDVKSSAIKLDESDEYNRLSNLAGRISLSLVNALDLHRPFIIRGLLTSDPSIFSHFQIIYSLKLVEYGADHSEIIDLPELTDEILLNTVRNCTSLTSIILNSCDFLTDRVLDVIPGGPHLRHLNLSGCWNFTEESLGKLLKVCPEITFLSLAGCPQVTDKTIITVSKYLLKIKELNVSDCVKLSANAFTKLQQIKSIVILIAKFSVNDYKNNSVQLNNKTLGVLGLSDRLEELNISKCTGVTDKGISTFGQSAKLDNLRELALDNCGHLSPIALLQMLRELPHVTNLSLREYKIKGLKGVKVPRLEHIKKLDLAFSTAFYSFDLKKFINKFTGLEFLSLSYVTFDHGSADRSLSETLAHRMTSLKYLNTWKFDLPAISNTNAFPALRQYADEGIPWFGDLPQVDAWYCPNISCEIIRYSSARHNINKLYLNYNDSYLNRVHNRIDTLDTVFPDVTEIYIENAHIDDWESCLNEFSAMPKLKLVQISRPYDMECTVEELLTPLPNQQFEVKYDLLSREDLEKLEIRLSKSEYEYEELRFK